MRAKAADNWSHCLMQAPCAHPAKLFSVELLGRALSELSRRVAVRNSEISTPNADNDSRKTLKP